MGPRDKSLGSRPRAPSLRVGHQGPATCSPGFSVHWRMPLRSQGVPDATGWGMLGQCLALRTASRTLFFPQAVLCRLLGAPPGQKTQGQQTSVPTLAPPQCSLADWASSSGRLCGTHTPCPVVNPWVIKPTWDLGCVPSSRFHKRKSLPSRGRSQLSPRSQPPSLWAWIACLCPAQLSGPSLRQSSCLQVGRRAADMVGCAGVSLLISACELVLPLRKKLHPPLKSLIERPLLSH